MSTSNGEAAEQVVRMMLSGTEISAKLVASATKNLVAFSVALARTTRSPVSVNSTSAHAGRIDAYL